MHSTIQLIPPRVNECLDQIDHARLPSLITMPAITALHIFKPKI